MFSSADYKYFSYKEGEWARVKACYAAVRKQDELRRMAKLAAELDKATHGGEVEDMHR